MSVPQMKVTCKAYTCEHAYIKRKNRKNYFETIPFPKGNKKTVFEDLDHASAVIRLTPQFFDRKAFSRNVFAGALS